MITGRQNGKEGAVKVVLSEKYAPTADDPKEVSNAETAPSSEAQTMPELRKENT